MTLSMISDKPATVHVHEYEQQIVVNLNAGEPAVASFTADRAGRFAVHVMGIDLSHPEVAAIQSPPAMIVAHVFLAPYTLPVPFWLYLYGCAAALVLSFALLAYLASSGPGSRSSRALRTCSAAG